MIVRGFVEPISRELPMEYALELNRLVELQMEGSVADYHGTNSGNQHSRCGSERSVCESGSHASSADRSPRSFDVDAFEVPDRKQDDWRYTPVERVEEFFNAFTPSNETQIAVTMIDGTALTEGVTYSEGKPGDADTGIVSKPCDRVSAVEWNSASRAGILRIDGEISQPILVKIHGAGTDLDAFHLVIIAADRAHADVVVEHDGDARIAEGVEILTGRDSHVSTTFIQEWNKGSKHVGNQRIHLGEGASLRHSVVTLGGDVVRIRMDQDFGGDQGDLNMLGIYFVDPGEHIEHRTMIVHNHPSARVVWYIKALLTARAHTPHGSQRADRSDCAGYRLV